MASIGPDRISCLMTDNAKNMQKAWTLVKEVHPHIVTLGCAAHGLNLLLKDFLQSNAIQEFLNTASDIVKTVNNRGILRHNFQQVVSLKSSVPTRWLSWEDSLDSIQKNIHSLRQLAVHPEAEKELEPRLRRAILGDPFWETLSGLLSIISPVSSWIRFIEGNMPGISVLPAIFNELNCLQSGLFEKVSFVYL